MKIMNNKYTITTRFLDANDPKNIFHENALFFELTGLRCGVFLCPDSTTAGVFAEDLELKRIIGEVWDIMGCTIMVAQASKEHGTHGAIDVCIHFLKEIGEWTLEAYETYQNENTEPSEDDSGVSA